MTGNYVGYARVLGVEQDDLEKQIKNLNQYALEHNITFKIIFSEEDHEVSSKGDRQDKREELFKYVREGDTVVIDSCFRISRTLRDLLYIIDFLEDKKVTFISLKENFNSNEATSAMIRNYMNSMVQYEMNLMLERQSEGIRIAKELGKYKGRKTIKKPDNFDECYKKYYKKYSESTRFNKYTFKQFMADTGLKEATLLRLIASTRNLVNESVD